MGIRLKILSLILFLSYTGCKTQKNKIELNSKEESYVLAYKKSVLFGCINEKTNKDFRKMLDNHGDLGLYTEVEILFHEIAKEAYAQGMDYSNEITPVNYPDADGKLPIFRDCVSYAFSNKVDSIARVSYRRTR